MPAPVISSDPLAPKNKSIENGRYVFAFNEPVILFFSVESSGNSDPWVKMSINWGDNTPLVTEKVQVGRIVQFTHVIDKEGDYFVLVSATNSDGETSILGQNTILPLKILQPRPETEETPYWSGLALPTKQIGTGLKAVEDILPSFALPLASEAAQGSFEIALVSAPIGILPDTQVVLSEEGKMFTAARVISVDANIVKLDREIHDTYSALKGQAEFKQRVLRQSPDLIPEKSSTWFFPISRDSALIKASLSMLLSTGYGERLNRPTYGSGIQDLVFDQLDRFLEAKMRANVSGAIERWEPRVEVVGVAFETQENNNQTRMRITLKERASLRGETFDVELSLTNPESL